ncbi:hypothetical protein BH09VER1_BH09VER1_14920 [soil metagenome]
MFIIWWVLGLVAILWSLLAIFRAPTFLLFQFALAATEYGNRVGTVLVMIGVGSFLCGSQAGWLLVVAAGVFFSPDWRARSYARAQHLDFYLAGERPNREVKRLSVSGEEGRRAEYIFTEGTKRPLVLVVHGGGWTQGEIGENAGFLTRLAQAGCFVASVSYGLAPAATWPSQLDDVLAGYEAVMKRREEFGIDPDRIFLLGRSAGGQIASAFACWEGAPPLRGCICLYAPFDMLFAYEHGREDDMLRSRQLLRQYLGGTPEEALENYRSASAFHRIGPSSPPFLLLHGTRDELVWIWQSRRLAERAREVGARCTFHEFPWATHAFDYRAYGPGSRVALAAIRDFITAQTVPG